MLPPPLMELSETDKKCYSYIVPGLGDFGDRYYCI
jgi:uracil phosphoribosyltransferase